MSKLGDLPEGVSSVMFLRDGWPDAIVCKVVMNNGCVGIGLFRPMLPVGPEISDRAALLDAMQHVSNQPPDYSELHEHAAKMKAEAEARSGVASPATAYQEEPETDEDLQAALGQKAHD
jgi:hypothetical protein